MLFIEHKTEVAMVHWVDREMEICFFATEGCHVIFCARQWNEVLQNCYLEVLGHYVMVEWPAV